MSHDELGAMAAGYALSALDPAELMLFEAHFATCPECRTTVAGMRPLVEALSMMTEEAEPVDGLRQRISESARAEPGNPGPVRKAGPENAARWQ